MFIKNMCVIMQNTEIEKNLMLNAGQVGSYPFEI